MLDFKLKVVFLYHKTIYNNMLHTSVPLYMRPYSNAQFMIAKGADLKQAFFIHMPSLPRYNK